MRIASILLFLAAPALAGDRVIFLVGENEYGSHETILIRGGSCVVDPFGEVLAGPAYGEHTILRAELDLDQVTRGKYDLDVVGHYERPDVFRLEVEEGPRG